MDAEWKAYFAADEYEGVEEAPLGWWPPFRTRNGC